LRVGRWCKRYWMGFRLDVIGSVFPFVCAILRNFFAGLRLWCFCNVRLLIAITVSFFFLVAARYVEVNEDKFFFNFRDCLFFCSSLRQSSNTDSRSWLVRIDVYSL
jgi:hypothetical protein